MNKQSRSTGQAGFTLTEVLVALAILSVAIVSLMTLITQNVRITTDMEKRLMAGIVAENILVEGLAAYSVSDTLTREGEVTVAGQSWRWVRELEPTPIEGMYRITVDVRLEGSDEIAGTVTAFRKGG